MILTYIVKLQQYVQEEYNEIMLNLQSFSQFFESYGAILEKDGVYEPHL